MEQIFIAVATGLGQASRLLGISYVEVNVLVYFLLVPLLLASLVDARLGLHLAKISVSAAFLMSLCLFPSFGQFSEVLFANSVKFLKLFGPLGVDYVQSSVLFCVVAPIAASLLLAVCPFPRWPRRAAR